MPIVAALLDLKTILLSGAIAGALSLAVALAVTRRWPRAIAPPAPGPLRTLAPRLGDRLIDGLWLSRRVQESAAGPAAIVIDEHEVVIADDGDDDVLGLSTPDAELKLLLELDDAMVLGRWRVSYADGERHAHGTCQLRIAPDAQTLVGVWIGFSETGAMCRGSWMLQRIGARVD